MRPLAFIGQAVHKTRPRSGKPEDKNMLVKEQMHTAGKIGTEFEGMTLTGNISPDLWMKKATGAPVGPQALLAAAESALNDIEKR